VLRASVHAGLGLALAATLGAASGGGAAQADSPAAAAEKVCTSSGLSHARVGPGGSEGEDPNSVSAAEAQRMEDALQARIAELEGAGTLRSSGEPAKRGLFRVRTHVHVITRSDGTGGVTRDQIRAQLRVLNDGFAGRTSAAAAATPFRFDLASVDVTRNDTWYAWSLEENGEETAPAKAAKRALHRGGWADLNIYIAGLQDGLLGYSAFPQDSWLKLDGLVLLNESLPGGALAPFNEGDTATHEIGHWLGLFHTFENGCTPPGDFVKDTPYQADGENIFYCGDDPVFGDDTCPQPGKDPVHNFMSYGDDPCLDRFTPGQAMREVWTWLAYRQGR
jgi:hypothetical protein